MKNPSVIALGKIHAARQWVFRWRGLDGTPLRGILALLITSGLFALVAATVRIRVSAPRQWVEKKASIIHLPTGGEGKIWALRALEGGPFPSRFDPAEWAEISGTSASLPMATRLAQSAYEPKLRDLPVSGGISPVPLASADERVFPKRRQESVPAAPLPPTRLVPMLYPLSGITAENLPRELPPFDAEVGAAMAAAPWRFLVRLRPDGSVMNCDAMPDETGGEVLRSWIRGINFGPEVAEKSPWISIGVGFINQPAHGPDPR